jgi:4-diphosphocytidyl-2C-methyl-D-erythritol kinase
MSGSGSTVFGVFEGQVKLSNGELETSTVEQVAPVEIVS